MRYETIQTLRKIFKICLPLAVGIILFTVVFMLVVIDEGFSIIKEEGVLTFKDNLDNYDLYRLTIDGSSYDIHISDDLAKGLIIGNIYYLEIKYQDGSYTLIKSINKGLPGINYGC